ncbi:hypothetical protein [Roseobacter litoralis]|uniref:hypothetical protein n=1 Tax=Roseobacter litoralis TaxID=42443 RepID=UPI002492447C|nr:hypothetical protein [Roseobacter litoralis]
MKVKIHRLYDYLLESTQPKSEAIVGLSLSASPTFGDFIADIDPSLSLDWNNRDFRGLPLDAPRRDPAYTFDFPYEPEQSNRAGAGSECVARNR